jgi:antitoxin component of MazEF toxin-antitoxin module
MYYMPVFRVRRIGNSLGVLFPKDFIAERKLRLNDEVRVDVRVEGDFKSTAGALKHLGLTVDEMNDITNEGELD